MRAEAFSSQIVSHSTNLDSTGSTHLELEANQPESPLRGRRMNTAMMNRASNGIPANARRRHWNASIGTSVRSATESIGKGTIRRSRSTLEPAAKAPTIYAGGLLWEKGDEITSSTAHWSLTADPAPHVPLDEFSNLPAIRTITEYPHLFSIVCPVNVDRFQSLLISHPNPMLVESVCRSLREGFWPWAHTNHGCYPDTWDNSDRPLKTQAEVDFVDAQISKEVKLGRYSQPFASLHPGMYFSPLHIPSLSPGLTVFALSMISRMACSLQIV